MLNSTFSFFISVFSNCLCLDEWLQIFVVYYTIVIFLSKFSEHSISYTLWLTQKFVHEFYMWNPVLPLILGNTIRHMANKDVMTVLKIKNSKGCHRCMSHCVANIPMSCMYIHLCGQKIDTQLGKKFLLFIDVSLHRYNTKGLSK